MPSKPSKASRTIGSWRCCAGISIERHALQCGFCTPGMLMMARDILLRLHHPDAETVRHQLSGQICRCTGYANIVKAIVAAGKALASHTDAA